MSDRDITNATFLLPAIWLSYPKKHNKIIFKGVIFSKYLICWNTLFSNMMPDMLFSLDYSSGLRRIQSKQLGVCYDGDQCEYQATWQIYLANHIVPKHYGVDTIVTNVALNLIQNQL